ncbi:alkaline phosphatase family protein [Nocardioides dongkuii]|uniref:alkaline phosphatase family protein n=1 Tax=Nocardioides dongkuii TaxID=2760089 RepID=UPI0015FDD928|nr:alkaline phosphatase family protein [Nocardioides dongkuii]
MRTSTALVLAGLLALLGLPAPAVHALEATPDGTTSSAAPSGRRVLAISVDGLNPTALRRLGPRRTPTLHRLVDEGAATLNARTEHEVTVTLPNHTSMVTGRRVAADHGGHGVTWNDDLPGRTVHGAAGHRVASMFTVVHRSGGESAVFAGKSKFSLFPHSWPRAVDRFTYDERPLALVRAARRDLLRHDRELTFLHLRLPDSAGHASGFMTAPYLQAVRRTDALIGKLVRTIDAHRRLAEDLVVVLTADHGGRGDGHQDPARLANYRIPFLAWGAGVRAANLYALNPRREPPERTRPSYAARRQPIRNGDLANLVTSLLGLRAVPGSGIGARQDLVVR